MKALTIHQPYAALIVTPPALIPPGDVPKRVENRTWRTDYRGPVMIHAGLSRASLTIDSDRGSEEAVIDHWREAKVPLAFGAIVGVAWIIDCLSIEEAKAPECRHKWVKKHAHTHGPFCFLLDGCRPLVQPIVVRGAQKYWDVPGEVILQSRILRFTTSGAIDRRNGPGTVEAYRQWGLKQKFPLHVDG